MGEILGVERVGINDDFYALGGNSIRAIKLVSIMKDKGYSIPLDKLIIKRRICDINLEEAMSDTERMLIWDTVSEDNVIFNKDERNELKRGITFELSADETKKLAESAMSNGITPIEYMVSGIASSESFGEYDRIIYGYASEIINPLNDSVYCYDVKHIGIGCETKISADTPTAGFDTSIREKTIAVLYNDSGIDKETNIFDFAKYADKLIYVNITEGRITISAYGFDKNISKSHIIPDTNAECDMYDEIRKYLDLCGRKAEKSQIIKEYPITPAMKFTYDMGIRFSFDTIDIKGTPGCEKKIRCAWRETVEAAEVICSTINMENGTMQIRDSEAIPELKLIDLTCYDKKEKAGILVKISGLLNVYMSDACYKGTFPAGNAVLVRLDSENYRILMGITHLIFDQQAREIFNEEFIKSYMNRGKAVFGDYGKFVEFAAAQNENTIIDENLTEFKEVLCSGNYQASISNISTVNINFDVSEYNFMADDIYNISLKIYQKILDKINAERIPVAVISAGRKYSENSFMDIVGECIDLVPVVYDKKTDLSKLIESRLTAVRDNDICCLAMFGKTGIDTNNIQNVFVLNYLGMFDEFTVDGVKYDSGYSYITVSGYSDNMIKFMNLPVVDSIESDEIFAEVIKEYLE